MGKQGGHSRRETAQDVEDARRWWRLSNRAAGADYAPCRADIADAFDAALGTERSYAPVPTERDVHVRHANPFLFLILTAQRASGRLRKSPATRMEPAAEHGWCLRPRAATGSRAHR